MLQYRQHGEKAVSTSVPVVYNPVRLASRKAGAEYHICLALVNRLDQTLAQAGPQETRTAYDEYLMDNCQLWSNLNGKSNWSNW